MKAAAAKKMAGVSTGLGAIGSLEWVAMVSLVVGAAEAAASSAAAKEGLRIIQQYQEERRALLGEGVFFQVGRIQEIQHPAPDLWCVPVTTSGFIYDGDEFVGVKDANGQIHSLPWAAVECYKYRANG